ncbi:MAG: PAAR domain-containing protein, partial [Rhodocyclales bacterium]|nr:PAAR domain-containing protein [Rhodocyclales bacterium]
MGKPASRVGDNHDCPKKDGRKHHVGGPVTAGCDTVLINGKPAARA